MKRSRSLAEMTMEDLSFIDQDEMNTFNELISEEFAAAVYGGNRQHSYSFDSLSPNLTFSPSPVELEATQTCFENPTKQLTKEQGPSSSNSLPSQGSNMNKHSGTKSRQGKQGKNISASTQPTSCTQHHIMAERKRREKLSQQFIALTAIVPGLKKTDKTSVLGQSINYMKELQGRLRTLEEENAKKTMESVVFVKKFQIPLEGDSSPSDEPLPEISIRVCGKSVLIRIHCEKQKGVLLKTLAAIEKLHLSVTNSSTIPFGNSTLDITVVAMIEDEFNIGGKDLVENMGSAFHQFM